MFFHSYFSSWFGFFPKPYLTFLKIYKEENPISLKKTARFAGFLYIIMGIPSAFGIAYVPSKIIDWGNAIITFNNIMTHEFLFRMGMVSQFISNVLFILLVSVLYHLFKQVNSFQSRLMVALVLVQVPIGFVIETFNMASLLILKGEIMKALTLEQKQEWVMLFVTMHKYGMIIIEIFSGLWLIPFGQLVYKSQFIPRILGILLVMGGIAYIIESLSFWLFPDYQPVVSSFMMIIYTIGETPIIFWLLIKGTKSVGKYNNKPDINQANES
jgi:hypothetical protein